jgi:amidase
MIAELHCFVHGSVELPPTGDGPLANVGVAVKDLFAVAGCSASFGHPRWRATHLPAEQDAVAVARLRSAGAHVVGRTKMDQLAYSLIGNVGEGNAPINPSDPECFCGGSSSGSASAVAGGLAELGLGTDTAGSIRVPAAATGLFGIRPSHEHIDVAGAIPLASSFDVVGFLARDPGLLATAVISTTRGDRRYIDAATFRGVLLGGNGLVSPAGDSALRRFAASISSLIAQPVKPVDTKSFVNAELGNLFARIQGREIWAHHSEWLADNMRFLAREVQQRLRRCEEFASDDYVTVSADLEARVAYARSLVDLLGTDCILVLPVLAARGPLRSSSADDLLDFRLKCFQLAAPSSLSGLPQVVLPTAAGPVSMVGPHGSDLALLTLAQSVVENAPS